jgi:response regulator RpfG family c-di-GMP phosphodiesterase
MSSATSTAVRRRVLLVDDDRLMLAVLRDALVSRFDVTTAGSGENARDLLAREDFAAIASDHIMPGLTGVELLQWAMEHCPKAARILVTASESAKDIRDAVNLARVHRVVGKPVQPAALESVVAGAIHEVELERENARLVAELRAALGELAERERELERELQIRTAELQEVMAQLRARR